MKTPRAVSNIIQWDDGTYSVHAVITEKGRSWSDLTYGAINTLDDLLRFFAIVDKRIKEATEDDRKGGAK